MDPSERLAMARAKLNQPRAETYRFTTAGDEIVGVVVRLDVADTEYGSCRIVVLDTGDGQRRNIWLIHDALRSQMEKLKPQIDDAIAVRYLGKKLSAAGREYHAYTVTTDKDRPQFSWDSPDEDERNPFDEDPPF